MAILKIKDENGVFINIPSIKGDKGEKGDVGPQGPKGDTPDLTGIENSINELTNKTNGYDITLSELRDKDNELQEKTMDLDQNKQDKLIAGDGIVITEDNVINSLGIKIITIEGDYTTENPYFLDTTKFNTGDLLQFPDGLNYVTIVEGKTPTTITPGLYMFKYANDVGGFPACRLVLQDNSTYILTYYLRISGSQNYKEITQVEVSKIVETDRANTFTVVPRTSKEPTNDADLTNKLYVDTAIATAITGALEGEY